MDDAPPPKVDRSLAIDAVKGIGILQVVLHHSLGQGARTFSTKGDPSWTAMRVWAWATNFAIPLFLLLSALLLAGSFAKSPNVGRFIWRRVSRTVWPYVVWTGAYWLLRSRSNPRIFDDPDRLVLELLTGKASYHLYFMVILVQLSLAVPFVVLALRGRKIGFGPMLALCGALQLGFFYLNRVPAFYVSSPGSLLTWYVGPLLLGAWIALNREAWNEVWKRGWPWMTAVGLAACVAFTYFNVEKELGLPIDSLSYNSLSVVFRVGLSLALLGAAVPLAATRIGPFLAALGRYSLPIYLVHPAILRFLGRPSVTEVLRQTPGAALWLAVIVAAASYAFAVLVATVRLDGPLFGQSLPRRTA